MAKPARRALEQDVGGRAPISDYPVQTPLGVLVVGGTTGIGQVLEELAGLALGEVPRPREDRGHGVLDSTDPFVFGEEGGDDDAGGVHARHDGASNRFQSTLARHSPLLL